MSNERKRPFIPDNGDFTGPSLAVCRRQWTTPLPHSTFVLLCLPRFLFMESYESYNIVVLQELQYQTNTSDTLKLVAWSYVEFGQFVETFFFYRQFFSVNADSSNDNAWLNRNLLWCPLVYHMLEKMLQSRQMAVFPLSYRAYVPHLNAFHYWPHNNKCVQMS